MATINESIKQLTASLQELTAEEATSGRERDLSCSGVALVFTPATEVESFLEASRVHAQRSREISIGTY